MIFGWTGKILRIDLTRREVRIDSTLKYTKDFIGGRGIAAKILFDECLPNVQALDPESLLIFSTGPLAGTCIPGGGRIEVTCKSPLTVPEGMKCETGFGGFWGPELKFAGYDHLVVTGRSPHPVYITIDNDEIEIKDAQTLWGKDAYTTVDLIKEAFDIDSRVVAIGEAGEKLVRFASILGGERYSASGRGGAGAVMGSKNLKGIAVRGTGEVKVAHPAELLEITEKWHELIKKMPNYEDIKVQGEFREHLTTALDFCAVGNYEAAEYPPLREMHPDEFRETYLTKMVGCIGCPRACFPFMRVPGSAPGGLACSSIIMMASMVWNNDIQTMWEASTLCNTYCMDVTETAGCIGFLMELHQKGILNSADTEGIPFERGNRKAILDAIHRIAKRESYGDMLADGLPRAAARIGRDVEEYAVHTKGLFPHGYKFQAFKGHSLMQSVGHMAGDPFPISPSLRLELAYHNPPVNPIARKIGRERYGTEEALEPGQYGEAKVDAVIDTEHSSRCADLLGTCTRQVPNVISEEMALRAFNAATGETLKMEDLIRVEEKLVHLERAFDARAGVRREDDTLPAKFFTHKIDSGRFKGSVIDKEKFERMKDIYYQKRGWDPNTGIPTRKTLETMGLGDIADQLRDLGRSDR